MQSTLTYCGEYFAQSYYGILLQFWFSRKIYSLVSVIRGFMKPFTVVQYLIFSQFLIEHIQIFKEQYFCPISVQLNRSQMVFSAYRDKSIGT